MSHTVAPLVPPHTRFDAAKFGRGRRHPQSIVSISSASELSRYGARHVGRLGAADLDSSGLLVLR